MNEVSRSVCTARQLRRNAPRSGVGRKSVIFRSNSSGSPRKVEASRLSTSAIAGALQLVFKEVEGWDLSEGLCLNTAHLRLQVALVSCGTVTRAG